MKTALIVIDVQNGFAVENAERLPKKIVKHLENENYNYVLFTQSINDPESNFHKILNWKKGVDGDFIEIHPLLRPYLTESNTFKKNSYSAFKSQDLVKFLQDKNVEKIFLCGINTDACVLASAFEAFDLGYNFDIIDELCSVSSFRQDYIDSANTIITRNLRRKN